MTINWQIASFGWDDSPRIDLHVNRRESQRRQLLRARRKVLGLVCILVYAGAVLCPGTLSIVDMRAHAASLLVKIKQTDGQIANLKQMAAALDVKDQQWKQYQALQRERRSWGDALSSIAAACPGKVYLDRIQVDGGRRAVTVEGNSDSTELVNDLVLGMQRSGAFSNVALAETSTDPNQTTGQLRFKVIADCNLPLNGD